MSSKQYSKYVQAKNLLSQLQGSDPKIIVRDNDVEIIPSYFNYSLVFNFIPILVCIYIITSANSVKIVLLGLLAFGIFIYNIVIQLIFCKRSIINFEKKNITIQPNFLFRIFQAKRIIEFNNIKSIKVSPYSFSALYQRFVIKLTLTNSSGVIIISIKEQEIAANISDALYSIIRNHN